MAIDRHGVGRIVSYLEQYDNLTKAVHELNNVNGDSEMVSIRPFVLGLVDQKLAAKELMSLVIEAQREVRGKLEALGVDPEAQR